MNELKNLEASLHSVQLQISKAQRLVKRYQDLKGEYLQSKRIGSVVSKLAAQSKKEEMTEIIETLEDMPLMVVKFNLQF